MSYITRTIRNFLKIGPKEYIHQLNTIGDTKAGILVGVDKYGNKYYEDKSETIYGRDRWVDFNQYYYDASQIPAEWHMWTHHIIEDPPSVEKPWIPKFQSVHQENTTGTKAAYVTYNTTAPKITAWEPQVKDRS
ncbi:uncharacterized protein VTP21DRAFT_11161 [Calcarisporiella thermophila]|uniref:uncharacterized protein n=1 Tax=Calcarisporiella thermophila TaxID=911321 RepID=UPI0037442A34